MQRFAPGVPFARHEPSTSGVRGPAHAIWERPALWMQRKRTVGRASVMGSLVGDDDLFGANRRIEETGQAHGCQGTDDLEHDEQRH